MIHLNTAGSLTGYATCPTCKEKKELSEFHNKKTTKHGYKSTCKTCEKINRKNYYLKNKDKEHKNHSEYMKHNKDSVNSKRNNRYYEIHEHKRLVANNYLKEKLSNPKQRVYEFALKYINRHKRSNSKSTILLGCNKTFFTTHIESYFNPEMNWDNYGIGDKKWSMDHSFPINCFNLNDGNEEIACFNYMNIRPMWFNENSSKKDKILWG